MRPSLRGGRTLPAATEALAVVAVIAVIAATATTAAIAVVGRPGPAHAAAARPGRTVARSLVVDGGTRTYRLHLPAARREGAPPLVLVFHGGGGQGSGMERLSRFSDLADREGFVAVYPDGLRRSWNDGRGATARGVVPDSDDVRFVDVLLDALRPEIGYDPARVYATGMSNGGFMVHTLGLRLGARIAAIAPVAGGIAPLLARAFHPVEPVSVLIVHGTADPLVPYRGGGVANGRGGFLIDTEEAAALWVTADRCGSEPVREALPDRDARDGCAVTTVRWSGGSRGTEVVLETITGGGHTWPGGAPYAPERFIGKVCRDVDATRQIWEFFAKHPKRPK